MNSFLPALTAALLLATGFAHAQAAGEQREFPNRQSAAKSAISKAQGWRDSGDSGSLNEDSLRQAGSAEKGIEQSAREKAPGGGSAESIMKLFEQEAEKGLSGVQIGR
jgi:hypothetical protein